MFITLFGCARVLVMTCGVFVAAHRIFNCNVQTLSLGMWDLPFVREVPVSIVTVLAIQQNIKCTEFPIYTIYMIWVDNP